MAGRLFERVIDKSRELLQETTAALRVGFERRTTPPPRNHRGTQLGQLEDRLLFSAAPIDPALLTGDQTSGADQGAVVVIDASDALAIDATTATQDAEFEFFADADATEVADGSATTLDEASAALSGAVASAEGSGDDALSRLDQDDAGFVFFTADAAAVQAETAQTEDPTGSPETTTDTVRKELVFVDTGAQDYQQLVDDLLAQRNDGRQVDVILLDSSQDGIVQITQALANYNDLDAIHLVSHGTDRALKLGSTWLQLDNVDAYAGQIATWNDALATDADLLIYGCDLAAGEDGLTLIEGLSQLTGADVAASSDDTGAAALGGDWDLEYQTGDIEAAVAFSANVQQTWMGLLNTFTVTNTNDSGAGSLRQAIIDANALGGTDTIQFSIAVTDARHFYYVDDGIAGQVTLGNITTTTAATDASLVNPDADFAKSWYSIQVASALPTITDAVVIDGTTQAGYTDSPIIELDGSVAGLGANGITLTAGSSTIRGLVIDQFGGDGIEIWSGPGGNVVQGNYIGVDVSGSLDLGNGVHGIYLETSGNVIGGTTAAARNVISGNQAGGVYINANSGNLIQGNYIGINAAGSAAIGNTYGIFSQSAATGNTFGGTDPGAGNVISGNSIGIAILSGSSSVVQGNYIGTDASGMTDVGNTTGIMISGSANNSVGGTTASARNVISGNDSTGVLISGAGATGNLVQGNYIGTDATGNGDLQNSEDGVRIQSSAGNNTIGGTGAGAANVIAYNLRDGVALATSAGSGNTVRGNAIHDNVGMGIDLNDANDNIVTANDAGDVDTGANNLQNFPVLSNAVSVGGNTSIWGAINSTASTTLDIDFYSSPTADGTGYGEGQVYLGSVQVTTDGSGNATINEFLAGVTVTAGHVVTATATDPSGNTSEFSFAVTAMDNLLVVDTTSDVADGTTTSIAALLADRGADGLISLREAITATNATANGATPDQIHFDIAAALIGGAHTIQPGSALPTITDAVIIDGTTEPDFAGTPIIELDGSNAGALSNGLQIEAGSSTVRGLVINRFNFGVYMLTAGGNVLVGNYVGTDVTGSINLGNTYYGIFVDIGSDANTIGGTDAASGNVISGNNSHGILVHAADQVIQGNIIGLNASGDAALGNWSAGIRVLSAGTLIGGTTAGARNIISGNSGAGIYLGGISATIQGNYIGTDITGMLDLGNSGEGISVEISSSNAQIGGVTTAARNIISGNSGSGIALIGASDTTIEGNYIGVDVTGTGALGNLFGGISLSYASTNNTIGGTAAGAGNVIAHSTFLGGVVVGSSTATGNAIIGNSIFSNTGLGIDLGGAGVTANDAGDADAGANNLQNFPVLSNAVSVGGNTSIWGTINSTASTTFDIHFYSSPSADGTGYGEGQVYLGSTQVTTDGSGNATINEFLAGVTVTAGHVVTATATDPSGNTSEFSFAVTAMDNLLVVDTTSDVADGNTTSIAALLADRGGDGLISLREALTATNATANGATADQIHFDIAAPLVGGAHTIRPGSELPTVTDAVIIDGTTEPDFAGTPIIELDGSNAGETIAGLRIHAGDSTVRGLVINHFRYGVYMILAGGNVLEGNYLGTDVTGNIDGNNYYGIYAATESDGNIIGGTDAGSGNVISGATFYGIYASADGQIIQGNIIGLNASGDAALGNGIAGIRVTPNADGTVIGGTTAGARNTISGNSNDGIYLEGDSVTIQGNYIGTDITGMLDLGNGQNGIAVEYGGNAQIGGVTAAARNVIAGNDQFGITMSGASGITIEGNYIGVDVTGTGALGTGFAGISLGNTSTNNTIGGTAVGAGNVIAHSSLLGGVVVSSSADAGNAIIGNSIFSNTGLGIDLGGDGLTANDAGDADTGANNLQNFPDLVAATVRDGNTTVYGSLNSTANTTFDLHFYSSPTADGSGYGEGQVYLGSAQVTTDASGNASISVVLSISVPLGQVVTATATDPGGNTSEFSLAVTAVENHAPVATDEAYSVDEDVVLAIGTGATFTDHAVTTTADGAYSVTAADVDGDGDMDMLSASFWDDTIAWYENDGSQNFTAHTITATAIDARSVVAADIDGDGDLDVLSGTGIGSTVTWYENDGSQNFTAHTIDTADAVYSVSAADVDGDGDMDVLSTSAIDDTVTWYENDGSQNFTARTITNTALGARSVVATDVDGDGDMDVLSASYDDNTIAWYENDGSQNFTARTITSTANGALSVYAADVDGDGDTDVLSASYADNTIAWYENDGSQNFTARTITTAASGARSVYAADIDDDGDLDVLSASMLNNTIAWYTNDGSQNFTTQAITTTASLALSVYAADIDGDGDLDVLSASINDDTIAWHENDGTGVLANDTDVEDDPLTAILVGGPTDGVLTLNNSGSFVYTPDADFYGTDTFTYKANDGTDDSNVATVTITVNPVNDAPVEASIEAGALAYTENDGQVAVTGSITISDVDDTNIESAVIQITAAYANGEDLLAFTDTGSIAGSWDALTGTLTLTGTDTLANYDLALRSVTYQNTSDDPDTTARTVSFTVNDGETDSNTQSRDIAITAENDAPVEASIEAGTLAYTENDGAVAVTGSVTISDVDDTNIESAVIQITAAYVNGEDLLAFTDTGSITGSWDALTGTLTLTGTDTLANYDLALRSVTYENTSDNPTTATRTVNFTVNDGDVDSNTQTRDIAITAENDAPVEASIEAGALAYTENDGAVAVTGSITISDLDDTNIESAVIQITAAYVNGEDLLAFADTGSITGSWDALTGTLTLTGTDTLANYDLALRSVTYQNTSDDPSTTTRTVSFTVNDGDIDSNTQSRDIAITAENDAPVEASIEVGALAYTENDGAVAVTGSITISDLDDTNIESAVIQITAAYVNGEDVLAFADTGSITGSWDALTGTLTLSGTDTLANYDLALRSVTYENTSDDPSTATRTVSFTVNDGDVDSNTQSRDIAITAENDAPVEASIETGALAYTENDGQVAVTASITISDGDDTNIESAVIQITAAYVNGEDLLAFTDTGSITGSWDALTGTLTLTGTDTLANYDLALRSVTYENTSDDPSTATRTVSFTVNDGDVDSNTQTRNIAITAQNDPAVLDLDANDSAASGADFATTFTEDGGPVAVADADATLTDLDNTNLSSLTVTITNQLDGVSETLAANTAGTSITASYNSGTGILTLSGVDTVAHYQQVLRTVRYDSSSQNPDTTARTITFVANDGTADSNVGTTTVTMVAQNDAPVALDDSLSTGEDTPVVISDASLLANDSDVDLDPLTISGFTQPANGNLVDNGDGTLTYTPDANFNGFDSFTYTISDGAGGTDTATVNITVNAINDAPVAGDDSFATQHAAPLVISAASLLANDTDIDLDALSISSFTQPSGGTLVDNGDGTLTYTPAVAFNGPDSFTYTVSDGNGGTATATVVIDVAAGGGSGGGGDDDGDDADDDPPPKDDPVPEDKVPTNRLTGGLYFMGDDDDPQPVWRSRRFRAGLGSPTLAAPMALQTDFDANTSRLRTSRSLESQLAIDPEVVIDDAVVDQTQFSVDIGLLVDKLDSAQQALGLDLNQFTIGIATVTGTLTLLAVGYTAWTIRGGYLLASLVASAPAWRAMDPLPILGALTDTDNNNKRGDHDNQEPLTTAIDQEEKSPTIAV